MAAYLENSEVTQGSMGKTFTKPRVGVQTNLLRFRYPPQLFTIVKTLVVNIMFIPDRCHRSSAPVTPVKYEND